MVTKELVIAAVGLIMGILNTFVGHEIFSNDQISQVAEIVFLTVTFIAAYKHKSSDKPADPITTADNKIQLP